MTRATPRRSLPDVSYPLHTAAPALAADAFVRGENRRRISLDEFRGTWVVVALGARPSDVRELAALEDAFTADGSVVLAAVPDDWHGVASGYSGESVRFPILSGVDEHRLTGGHKWKARGSGQQAVRSTQVFPEGEEGGVWL